MFKKIKKHFNKILIACLTLISSIAVFSSINKTYAYDSDKISYTIDKLYTNTNFNISDYNNYIDINNNNNLIISKNESAYFDSKSQFLLVNYVPLDSNNNPTFNYYNQRWQCTPLLYMTNGSYQCQSIYVNQRQDYVTNNQYFTTIVPIVYTYNSLGNIISVTFSYLFNTNDTNIRIYNIDFVSSADLGLDYYYETYYSQIEENYNQLLSDYNDLQDNYDTLNDDYLELNEQYDDTRNALQDLQGEYDDLEVDYTNLNNDYSNLQDDYNTLQDNYDSLENALDNLPNYNGMESFINSFNGATIRLSGYGGTGPISSAPTYTLENFNESNFNLSRDTGSFYTWIVNNINTYGGFDVYIELSQPYTTSLSVGFNNVNINHTISIYAEVNGLAIATFDDTDVPNNVIIINQNNNYSFVQISFSLTQNDYDINISSNIYGDSYMNGYNNGYNQSLLEWNDDLINARNTIQSQTQIIRSLQDTISAHDNGVNLNSLIWTIAGTPFESFKQIWNVDFLGVNISGLLTGFFTALIVLYVVKKFFL